MSSAEPSHGVARRWRAAGPVLLLVGVAALLAVTLKHPASTEGPIPPGTNVLVILCDTLRADHLGLYGYRRPTTPFLDSLAQRGWVYEEAYSHYSYTWPSVSNLFTGLPYSTLVRDGLFTGPTQAMDNGGLSERNRTLAQALTQAGVATAGVAANPYVTSRLGFGKGFSDFHDVYRWDPDFWKGDLHKYTADKVNQAGLAQLRRLEATGKPWFLYLHYFDTHMPYLAPAADRALFQDPSYARTGRVVNGYLVDPKGQMLKYLADDLKGWVEPGDLAYLVAQYDAAIHSFDGQIRRLFAELEARGLLDRTVVVLTADHGEAFLERGFWGHGYLSRGEEEHVPMIVIPPRGHGDEPARIGGIVTTTDLYYTLLRHFGALPGKTEGIPWWTMDLFSRHRLRRVAYTEGGRDAVILRGPRYSYYRYSGFVQMPVPLGFKDGEYLFDRGTDPAEMRDLFSAGRQRATAIRDRLLQGLGANVAWLPKPQGDPMHDADAETRRRLKALGYL